MTPAKNSRHHEHEGPLRFSTLAEAEDTLRRLDALWRHAREHDDQPSAERILETARLGRQRAQMIAGNKRVSAARRAEKEEIRQWFRIWLETPDAFFDWLELRKQSPEFQEKFGAAPPASGETETKE
jgi:hypothetical protein